MKPNRPAAPLLRRRTGAVLLLSLALLGACGGGDEGDEAAVEDRNAAQALQSAQARWVRAGLQDYRYTLRRFCFCLFEEDMVITVRAGAITSATFQPSGAAVAAERLRSVPTVAGLFALLEAAQTAQAAELRASYDAVDGHPQSLYVDYSRALADEEIGYTVSSLSAL